MNFAPPLSVTDRFSLAIDGLCRAVAARIAGGRMEAALIVLVWNRLRRIERMVLALVAAIRAGRFRTRRVMMARRMRADGAPLAQHPGLTGVPQGFAWLVRLVPYEAAGFASQLRCVLEEPEMVALLAAAPRMGRLLRPLCRMLGLEPGLVSPMAAIAPVAGPVSPATQGVSGLVAVLGGSDGVGLEMASAVFDSA